MMKLVLLSSEDCCYFGNSIALAGGAILPCPITRWARNDFDAVSFSGDRLAIVGPTGPGSAGKDVTPERAAIMAALGEYDSDDDVRDTLAAIRSM